MLLNVAQFTVFFLKSYFWVFIAMWIRGTLPRIRVDQMMSVCWKYLVPISFVNLIGTAVWMVIWPEGNQLVPYLMIVGTLAFIVIFFRRVLYHLRRAKPELYFNPAI